MRPKGLILSLVAAQLVCACVGSRAVESPLPDRCVAAPLPDTLSPSRDGFLREVLFAAPTPRTPRYDDYTRESYHIDKLDLARGLASEAARCGVRLHSVLIVGPGGPLWSYHVIAFLHDTGSYQVSRLVMPHARITFKGTGRIAPEEVEALVDSLTGSSLLHVGAPTWPDSVQPGLGREFSFDLLLARYGADSLALWHGRLWRRDAAATEEQVQRLLAPVDRILGLTRATYPDTTRATR